MQTAASSSPDVFLSYSHRDSTWVHSHLVKRLREEGVQVIIDKDDFAIGAYSVKAMEEAVTRCRHTILVLTPDWVASPWTNFEALLATTLGPLDRRVLPLLLKDCSLSAALAALVYVDFRLPCQREAEFKKLLNAIAATAPSAEPVQGEPVRQGLVALADLMQVPEVHKAVVAGTIHFEEVCEQIGVVSGYKKLHDQLHILQLYCYDRIVREAKKFPEDGVAVRNLREHEGTLRGIIAELRHIRQHASFPPGEMSWIENNLDPACEALRAAIENRETGKLRLTRGLLHRVLAIRPSEINTRLNDTARDLPLAKLIQTMDVVRDRMRSLKLDAEKVEQFELGVETLGRLSQALAELVAEHDRWQEIEQDLRLMEETWDGTLDGITDSWSRMRKIIEPITGGSAELWAAPFRQEARQLDDALAAQDQELAEDCFRGFRREAANRFHQVDVMLRDQCDELQKVAEPLAELLKRIEYDRPLAV